MRATDISRGRQILARFLALAEERLAHLTDLYETGRWKHYFTQAELLDNVRDAKKAVDAWKLLVSTEALPNNRPVNLDWLDKGRPLPPRRVLLPDVEHRQLSARFTQPTPSSPSPDVAFDPLPVVAEPIRIDSRVVVAPVQPAPTPAPVPVATRADAPKPPAWQNSLDFALMRERYPLLRKAG